MRPDSLISTPVDRRAALKWMLALAAVSAIDFSASDAGAAGPAGTLTDPDLLHPAVLWDRVLTEDEVKTVSVLCDVILPEDDHSPSASQLGVQDFINEWVSAPYPDQRDDLKIVRDGLVWLDAEAKRRFSKEFEELESGEKLQICDDIAFAPKAKPAFKEAAQFFARVRDLAMSAFYTTKEGMKDLQYVGNTPISAFRGPPPEVLARLGLV